MLSFRLNLLLLRYEYDPKTSAADVSENTSLTSGKKSWYSKLINVVKPEDVSPTKTSNTVVKCCMLVLGAY